MSQSKVLVLGGTGPAGLCVLRELLYRHHSIVAYARSPSKIPTDLSSNPRLAIVKGEMNDYETFSSALKGCSAIISHLGGDINNPHSNPTLYTNMYRNTIIPAMREHGIKKILLMGTIAISQPEDSYILVRPMIMAYLRLKANAMYRDLISNTKMFETEAGDLDWTIFRIGAIPGEPDEESWRKGREEGKLYVGPMGAKGWTMNTNRSLLARWLVDAVEGRAGDWVRKMPAVTRLAGS
jgi:nucleoside-diphosphate-sugar epimerase